LKMIILQKNGKGKGEEWPINITASLPAYRFEEVRTIPTRFGRRSIQRTFQQ
jgi:hypothetical protein